MLMPAGVDYFERLRLANDNIVDVTLRVRNPGGKVMAPAFKRPYRGVFPVAPTIFSEDGELDLEGQRRCIDFMIDAGSHGICILANFSEQFALTDQERETVMHAVLEHWAGPCQSALQPN